MDAEIIAIGSELLTPRRMDTNSLWLTDKLNSLGVEVVTKTIVGDDRERLTATVKAAADRSGIVIVTGGLGPTEDDLTRDSVASALGRGMSFRQELMDAIVDRFARMRRSMAENNRRQAYLIDGAEALDNPNGTAPGQWIPLPGKGAIALLPGPPREMMPMYQNHIETRLKAILPPAFIATVWYRIAGMGESDLDQLIAPVYTRYTNPVTTVLAKPGDVEVHLRARCATQAEADALLAEVAPQVRELLGDRVYSDDGAELEEALGRLLIARGATLAAAESCTGGMLGGRITNVPGSSAYFRGGFLTYTDQMKTALLGVPEELIREHTAVSEPVAKAMAQGARERTGADYALSVTGYAGPDGGTERDPAGTVYIGLASAGGVEARRISFIPDRYRVRSVACITAMDWLRKRLT
ncbi:MAG: competence/damage-inducible protein A [Acidobacteria bacterium]|nr:competence/damage-inducible protein A [Acidobacteriota bacterium]